MYIEGEKYTHKETDIISCFTLNAGFEHSIIHVPTHPIYYPIQHNDIHMAKVKIQNRI